MAHFTPTIEKNIHNAQRCLVGVIGGQPAVLVKIDGRDGDKKFVFRVATLSTQYKKLVGSLVDYVPTEDCDYYGAGGYFRPTGGEWNEALRTEFLGAEAVSLSQAAYNVGLRQNDLSDYLEFTAR